MLISSNNIIENGFTQAFSLNSSKVSIQDAGHSVDQNVISNRNKKFNISFQFDNNLEYLRKDLSAKKQLIVEALLEIGQTRLFKISQQSLADQLGCTRKHLNETIRELVKGGIIWKSDAKYRRCSWYSVNPKVYKFAKGLKYKFKAFETFLFSLLKRIYNIEVTPLIYLKDIFISPIRHSQVRKEVWLRAIDLTPIEKRDMFELPKFVDPVMDEITDTLKLEPIGQLKLAVFPSEVLQYHWRDLKKTSNVHNPFAWLMNRCYNHCKEKDINLDMQMYHLTVKHFGLDPQSSPVKQRIPANKLVIAKPSIQAESSDKPNQQEDAYQDATHVHASHIGATVPQSYHSKPVLSARQKEGRELDPAILARGLQMFAVPPEIRALIESQYLQKVE